MAEPTPEQTPEKKGPDPIDAWKVTSLEEAVKCPFPCYMVFETPLRMSSTVFRPKQEGNWYCIDCMAQYAMMECIHTRVIEHEFSGFPRVNHFPDTPDEVEELLNYVVNLMRCIGPVHSTKLEQWRSEMSQLGESFFYTKLAEPLTLDEKNEILRNRGEWDRIEGGYVGRLASYTRHFQIRGYKNGWKRLVEEWVKLFKKLNDSMAAFDAEARQEAEEMEKAYGDVEAPPVQEPEVQAVTQAVDEVKLD
jgi:hypothetical protein